MKLKLRATKIALALQVVLLSPSQALAHPMKGVGDFYAGVLHPLMSVECTLLIVALSLLAGQQNRKTAIGVLILFPLACGLGALVGMSLPLWPKLSMINTGALSVLGIMIAASLRLPVPVPVGFGAIFGFTTGWINSKELTPEISPWKFIVGLMIVALFLNCYGISLVRLANAQWAKIGVRVAGSWIAAVGILVLGLKV